MCLFGMTMVLLNMRRLFKQAINLGKRSIMEDEGIVDNVIDIEQINAEVALAQVEDRQEAFLDEQALNHVQELTDIAQAVEQNETSVQTLAIAMERVDVLAEMYGIQTLGLGREGFVENLTEKGIQAKDEVVKRAYAVAQGVMGTVIQRTKNTAARLAVNLRTLFTRATSYSKDATIIKERAKALVNGTLKDPEATFSKQIHIAHFTRGDQTVASTGEELLQALVSNFAAYQKVGKFMERFQHVFSFKGINKGTANFDELAEGFELSRYFPHQFTLGGSDALFGEEFLLTQFAGEANTIEEMISIVRGMKVSHEYIWRVKELEHQNLPPVSPKEIARVMDKLSEAGAYVYEFSRTWEQTIGKYARNASERASRPPWENLDFYKSPGNYLLYNQLYCRIILDLSSAVANAVATNEKALLCLLDYYKWSLNQHK